MPPSTPPRDQPETTEPVTMNIQNTSSECKQLNEYLYKNLAKHTASFISKNLLKREATPTRAAAMRACLDRFYPSDKKGNMEVSFLTPTGEKRWRSDKTGRVANREAIHDTVSMFIALKQEEITAWQQKGLTITSFIEHTDISTTVMNSLINYMIDQRRHEKTGQQAHENATIYLEAEQLQAATNKWEDNMIALLETDKIDNTRYLQLEEAIVSFKTTLNQEELVVLQFIMFPGRPEHKVELLNDCCIDLGIQRRQFYRRVDTIKSRASAFIKLFLQDKN